MGQTVKRGDKGEITHIKVGNSFVKHIILRWIVLTSLHSSLNLFAKIVAGIEEISKQFVFSFLLVVESKHVVSFKPFLFTMPLIKYFSLILLHVVDDYHLFKSFLIHLMVMFKISLFRSFHLYIVKF